jgi:hypothetical protein
VADIFSGVKRSDVMSPLQQFLDGKREFRRSRFWGVSL